MKIRRSTKTIFASSLWISVTRHHRGNNYSTDHVSSMWGYISFSARTFSRNYAYTHNRARSSMGINGMTN